jgi:hypothetical protein
MAAPSNIFWDHAGHLHTNALHWEGFPHLLWKTRCSFFYTEPPQYDGVEYQEEGVRPCRVKMTIPQHHFHSQWQRIEVDVVGYRLVDTIETAALEAIYLFCNQHPMDVAGQPIGLLPAIDPSDLEGNLRVAPDSHGLRGSTEEMFRDTIRFLNVQHHYQLLLRRGMG